MPETPPAPAGDVRPRLWAATARFVYADDRALDKIRPLLLKTIDSSSVAGFGEGLKRAVAVEEKAAPKQAAVKKAAPAQKVAVKKAPAKKAAKRTPNAAFMKALTPSSHLAAVVGDKPLPRTEVVKKLWAYIKKNGLQDATNKRNINADEKLKAVFGGKKTVSMFEMTSLVSKHLS